MTSFSKYTSYHFEIDKLTKKHKMFAFDSHCTAFSLGKCGGNDRRKPDARGDAEALLDFFLKNEGKDFIFSLWGA